LSITFEFEFGLEFHECSSQQKKYYLEKKIPGSKFSTIFRFLNKTIDETKHVDRLAARPRRARFLAPRVLPSCEQSLPLLLIHLPDAAQVEGGGGRRRGAGLGRGPLHLAPPPHPGQRVQAGRQGRRPRSSTPPPARLGACLCPNPRSDLTPTGSAVLKAAPGDEDAVRCKVVAHIKADEIDKALAAMRAAERLPIDFSFYKVMRVAPL